MRSRGKMRRRQEEVEKKNCKNCFVLPPTPAKCEQDVDEKEINRSDIEYEEERRRKVKGVRT